MRTRSTLALLLLAIGLAAIGTWVAIATRAEPSSDLGRGGVALLTRTVAATGGPPRTATESGSDDDVALGEREAEIPGLVIEPKRVDLGAIGHRIERTVDFVLENEGSVALEITKLTPSCDCMETTMTPGTLAPGSTRKGQVQIRFGQGFGLFEKYVNIWVKGHQLPVKFHVRAQHHPALERPKPTSFDLYGIVGSKTPENRATVLLQRKRTGGAVGKPLSVENLRVEGDRASAGMLAAERIDRGAEGVELVVTLSPEHPEGRVIGTLQATVEGLPFQMSVKGTVYRGIRTLPDHFQFHQMLEPEKAFCELALIPADARGFAIRSIEVDPPKVTIESRPRPEGGYVLTARPVPPYPTGEKGVALSVKVTIETDHPEKPRIELRCHGVFAGKPAGRTSEGKKP